MICCVRSLPTGWNDAAHRSSRAFSGVYRQLTMPWEVLGHAGVSISEESEDRAEFASRLSGPTPTRAPYGPMKSSARVNRASRDDAVNEAERSIQFLNDELTRTPVSRYSSDIPTRREPDEQAMIARARDEFAFRVIDPAGLRRRRTSFGRAVPNGSRCWRARLDVWLFVVDGYCMPRSMVQMNSGARRPTHRLAATKAFLRWVEECPPSIGRLLVKFTHRKRERVEAEYHAGEWMRVLRERGGEKVPTLVGFWGRSE